MSVMTVDPIQVDARPLNGASPVLSTPVPPAPAKIDGLGGGVAGRRREQAGYLILIAAVVLVIAFTFALSFHGLFEFARGIAYLPMLFSLAVPVGLDVFSLVSLISTFLCRDAPVRTRLYLWSVFLTTVAASVTGNALYAVASTNARTGGTHWGYMQVAAVVVAGFWPALSAGALHMLIIVRRHLTRVEDVPAEVDVEAREDLAAKATVLAYRGSSVADIVAELGVPERTVQRWTQPIREALAAAVQAAPVSPASPSARRPAKARAGQRT